MRDCFVADTPRNDIMKYQPIKFALPKGRFLTSTARLLNELDLGFADYNEKTRQYPLSFR